MSEINEILDEPLMRLVPYISAKTLNLILKLDKKQYGATKTIKTVRDLVECDIEDFKSMLIYKVGREYQEVLFEIEEGLALAGLKIKNSDFSPYDIRYERLNFSNTLIEKLKKAFPKAKTAGDISMLGTKRLVQAGITHHDLSRHINKIMHKYDMIIESDKKSVLRHSTYAKPVRTTKSKQSSVPKVSTNPETEQKTQPQTDSTLKVYKPADDEEIKGGKIVKKAEPIIAKKTTSTSKPTQKKNTSVLKDAIKLAQAKNEPATKSSSNTTSKPQDESPKTETVSATPNQAILSMSIEEFGFSKRTISGLQKILTIKTVKDLIIFGKNRLKNSSGLGPGAIFEIEVLLFKHGLALRDSKSHKKGIFKSYGKNAKTITAEEIRNLSLSELKVAVSDQRHLGNYRPKKKTVSTETQIITRPSENVEKESTVKPKQKRVKKAKLLNQQTETSDSEPEKVLPEIEVKNLLYSLKQYGIIALKSVNALSFIENSSDFDEIKIAINNYFNERIASTVEIAPSSAAIEKMKESIFDEMDEYEKIVTEKRESLRRSSLEIKRKTAGIVLRNSLKSLLNKFYQNQPSSGLISGDRVKLHTFAGPVARSENTFEQREM